MIYYCTILSIYYAAVVWFAQREGHRSTEDFMVCFVLTIPPTIYFWIN